MNGSSDPAPGMVPIKSDTLRARFLIEHYQEAS